jgi:hypothetical protein
LCSLSANEIVSGSRVNQFCELPVANLNTDLQGVSCAYTCDCVQRDQRFLFCVLARS